MTSSAPPLGGGGCRAHYGIQFRVIHPASTPYRGSNQSNRSVAHSASPSRVDKMKGGSEASRAVCFCSFCVLSVLAMGEG
uniref:Uncharacterized protein n=1 Tax=Picea glauca TaxID=3330 RepID=A0A101LVT0_PICGL|nr:hypothetical protein ABT39_MTgene1778 [Picea glauca]QHR86362.1 hypothetical protein Q903MT_gene361 [Picea sitchensis]